jgi:hypothetical protein
MPRTSISLAVGSIFLALAAGCSHQLASQPSASNPPPLPAANSTAAQPSPANLAQKTSRYAQEVSPLLDRKNTATATPREPADSVVEWGKPASPAQQAAAPAPSTQPEAVRHRIANCPAELAAARIGDDFSVPLILPESADRIAPLAKAAPAAVMSTDATEQKLQQLVRDYPHDLANQLNYQLIRFIKDEQTPDLSSVTNLSPEDREILSALMDGLSNFRNTTRADGNLMLSRKIQPLLEMADRLRSEAELTIPTIALCTRVDSFGVYKPVPSIRFAAGNVNEVIVYCEVANFTSIQNEQKMWETRLKEELVLYTDTGLAVWPEKSNAELFVDNARNRRHDFFIPRKIKLPATLTIGRYLLKITLTDERSNRVAEATTPIEIVAE